MGSPKAVEQLVGRCGVEHQTGFRLDNDGGLGNEVRAVDPD